MTKLKTALYLDDIRTPIITLDGYEPFVVVRNYQEFVDYIQENDVPDFITFDHDLGLEHMKDFYKNQHNGIDIIEYETFKEKTGLDCVKWLCDYLFEKHEETQKPIVFPIVRIHSANPVGCSNMYHYINNFAKVVDSPLDIDLKVTPFKMETQVEN